MSDFRKLILAPTSPISSVIGILESERARIVLIVDNKNHLLGTVTDGDVRRGLLHQFGMDTEAQEIMCSKPSVVTAKDSTDRSTILEQMQQLGLRQMPVVDGEGVVVGIETIIELSEQNKLENPVYLLAGGFGKRLHPLTIDTPKPLLKVGEKPILQMILESFIKAGFYKFYISTHYKSELVKSHFGNGSNWSVDIHYVDEKTPLGTAGGLGLLPKNLPDLPLIMMNGDLLTKVDFVRLLDYHVESRGSATMCVREYDFQVPFGVVHPSGDKVLSIEEKPVHHFFVNAGIYVLDPEVIHTVSSNEYLDMPNLLQDRIDKDETVNIFPLHEYWLDIGRLEEYERAQAEIGRVLDQ